MGDDKRSNITCRKNISAPDCPPGGDFPLDSVEMVKIPSIKYIYWPVLLYIGIGMTDSAITRNCFVNYRRKTRTAGQSFRCPRCSSEKTVWAGWRDSCLGRKHIRICKACSRRFVPGNVIGLRYSLDQVAYAARLRKSGCSFGVVKARFNKKYKRNLSRATVRYWETKYRLTDPGTVVLYVPSDSGGKTSTVESVALRTGITNDLHNPPKEVRPASVGAIRGTVMPTTLSLAPVIHASLGQAPISYWTGGTGIPDNHRIGLRITDVNQAERKSSEPVTSVLLARPQEPDHHDNDSLLYRKWNELTHQLDTNNIQPPSGEVKENIKENQRPEAQRVVSSDGPHVRDQPILSPEPTNAQMMAPMQENPILQRRQKAGIEYFFDTSLIAPPEHVGVSEIVGGVAGWYISGLVGSKVFHYISRLSQLKYQDKLAVVAKLIAEPVVGVFVGSVYDSIGIALGIPVSTDTSRAIVTGSLIRTGADIMDASSGYAAGIPQRESYSFLDTFIGFENIRYQLFEHQSRYQSTIPQSASLPEEYVTSDFCNVIGLGNIIDMSGLRLSSCDDFTNSEEMPWFSIQG